MDDFDLIKVLLLWLKQTGKLLEVACSMLGAFGKDTYLSKCRWIRKPAKELM